MRGLLTTKQRLLQANSRLQNENDKIREENKMLRAENGALKDRFEDLLLQFEELKEKIFGKKKDKDKKGKDDKDNKTGASGNSSKKPRDKSSYRRPIPTEDEITDVEHHTFDSTNNCCPDCSTPLTDLKTFERYVEDILPLAEWYQALKKVIKKYITTGWCSCCQKRQQATPFSGNKVIFGKNIKQFISYATVMLRLSYEQISDFLNGTINLKLSDGEITNILAQQANILRPEFEKLKERIRGAPAAHYDETSWSIQQPSMQTKHTGHYCWAMTPVGDSTDTVFALGKSRGKGVAEELKSNTNPEQIGISDDYGVYVNLFKIHELCWSHPFRKFRDLKNTQYLTGSKKEHCKNVYEEFATLYKEVQKISTSPFNKEERLKEKERLMKIFENIAAPDKNDPTKMKRIKGTLLKRKECYFVCITHPNIPLDNNKAERALRHLVLKRKNCFGSKTDKGADTMSILYSVILSLWWKSKKEFFKEYAVLFQTS